MKRVLIAAALAFAGVGGGIAGAQSLGGTDSSTSSGDMGFSATPGTPAPPAPEGSGVDQSLNPNQTDSDLPTSPSRTTETPEVPGSGRSGSELPDLGTPSPNLGEPSAAPLDQSAGGSHDYEGTHDEGSATLPAAPTTTPGINR